jgi:type II secretory pathway predicted ATPase ExeA
MHESFFGFRETPFSLLPDPAFLFLSNKHQRALSMLQYALMHRAGFAILSGQIGSGKTTLTRYLLNDMEEGVTVGLLANTHFSIGELMHWVMMSFGIKHRGMDEIECYEAFCKFVFREYAQGRRAVLIIDEAQNMSVAMLEELRLLSNINADKSHMLQLILVGQPEFRETLRDPMLTQLRQRVSVAYHLDHLACKDTYKYIRHRLRIAGAKMSPFRAGSYDLIHEYSGGIPRMINIICDTALVYAYGAGRKTIDGKLVREVVNDLERSGLYQPADFRGVESTQGSGDAAWAKSGSGNGVAEKGPGAVGAPKVKAKRGAKMVPL